MKQKLIILIQIWGCLEFFYQVQLRFTWTSDGTYLWEHYALVRNQISLNSIHNYFAHHYPKDRFYHEYDVETHEQPLSELPIEIQSHLQSLKKDLVSNGGLGGNRTHFSIQYLVEQNQYYLWIQAGARFRHDFNGYNLSITMTNSQYKVDGEVQVLPNTYVDTKSNQEYRWLPIILSYNCNRYDLLIVKILDPLVRFIVSNDE